MIYRHPNFEHYYVLTQTMHEMWLIASHSGGTVSTNNLNFEEMIEFKTMLARGGWESEEEISDRQ